MHWQKEHTGRLVIGDHKSTSHFRSGESLGWKWRVAGKWLQSPIVLDETLQNPRFYGGWIRWHPNAAYPFPYSAALENMLWPLDQPPVMFCHLLCTQDYVTMQCTLVKYKTTILFQFLIDIRCVKQTMRETFYCYVKMLEILSMLCFYLMLYHQH